MLLHFFYHLRRHHIPVSVKEFLTLIDALRHPIMPPSLDGFYHLSRLTLVKDESLFDKFDQAFTLFARGIETQLADLHKEIPLEWLLTTLEKELSKEEKDALQKHGWDALMALFKQRLEEQKERHAGGNKWIGTGGTSAFGHSGYHPEGIRVGGKSAGHRTAVKVWDERKFQAYDHQQSLGTRNIKMALRHLRRFARDGGQMEFDLENTIRQTAQNAGFLDICMVPEKRNAVKVLMLLDVGGSMDDHIQHVQTLFSAARSEFQHLEVYYFHNCLYEKIWRYHNHQRKYTPTWDLLHTYNEDWRLILVGDATMSPYEITYPSGSVEHNNQESGEVWLQRMVSHFPKHIWLNPEPQTHWKYRQSIAMIQTFFSQRMYPTTLEGIEEGMRFLST